MLAEDAGGRVHTSSGTCVSLTSVTDSARASAARSRSLEHGASRQPVMSVVAVMAQFCAGAPRGCARSTPTSCGRTGPDAPSGYTAAMTANLPTPLRGPRGFAAAAALLIAPGVLRLPRSPVLLARLAGLGVAAAVAADLARAASPAGGGARRSGPPPARPPAAPATPPATPGPRDARGPSTDAASSTEPQRRSDEPRPDPAVMAQRTDDDVLVAEEESAAAAAARAIGGPALNDADADPAMEPVYEAGGGEAEGYELAERELIRNATHDEGRADPEGDGFTPEAEADRATAEYGEPDQLRSTEGDESGTAVDEGPEGR